MTEDAKPIFPLTFNQCPSCGSENRMAGTVCKEQMAKGKLKKGTNASLFGHQTAIAGPVGTWLSAPMIQTYFDACVDCGTVYCIQASLGMVMAGGKIPNQPQQFKQN